MKTNSNKKKSPTKIEVNEKKYRELLDGLAAAVYTCDAEGRILFYNQAAIELWGREPKVGKDKWCGSFRIYKTDDTLLPLEECPMAIALKEGRIVQFEIIIERPDGTRRNIIPSPRPVFDADEKITGAYNTLIDITEQGKARKIIEESEKGIAELAAIVQFSDDAIIGKTMEGIITSWNQAAEKIFGYTAKEMIGNSITRIIPKERLNEEFEILERINKGEIVNHFETERITKEGKLLNISLTISPIKNSNGKIMGASKIVRDITKQKLFERELVDAKVCAENAVKFKQQFLANMSHEIRTPMTAIVGFSKVLLKTDLTAKQREYISAIKTSSDSLLVLINEILDLAKVDAGKMTFDQTPFKMEADISAMLHLFDLKFQEKNLELVKKYDHNIPKQLVGDSVRLNQIILNLISNAIKFTSEGKITVSIRLLSEDEETATIEFAVTDTGIGIPENMISTIFENFQQATTCTSRLYGGTGLGLAIVKKLVEMQGGTIKVKSKINEGSTFSFILNFKKVKTETKMEIKSIELKSEEETRNIKVLVVEDVALNQMLIRLILNGFGFESDIAENGKVAIEKLQSNAYDIVLMDLQMPEMNGFEATEQIRKKLNSNIPIIALTADVTAEDLIQCKAFGINDHLAKPIDEKQLYDKIVELVKK